MAQHHRTVIVGGGVAGASCLFHLARRGRTDCVLLEQRGLANGSTGHAPAFIETQYLRTDRVRMCAYGIELFEQFERDGALRFAHVGKLLLGHERDLAAFEQSVSFQESIGLSGARVLARDELAKVAPQLSLDGFEGALWGPRDGYVDPGQLTRVYVDRAERLGARALISAGVKRVARLPGGGFELETERGSFACESLVNAAGAWAGALVRELDIELPVRGYRRQVARFDLRPALDSPLPLIVEPPSQAGRPTLYFREDGPSSILAGMHSESVAADEPQDPDAYDRGSEADFERTLAKLVGDRFAAGYELQRSGGWGGLYPLTPDAEPVLGEAEAVPGLFNAAGLGGNGIQISAAVGRITAELLIDGNSTLLPSLHEYRLERFDTARG